ncbi:MAG: HNH endonuclease [Phycisphaerales bacterium]|nr:HNH endonuclease [Phycisphaerales bacterium]
MAIHEMIGDSRWDAPFFKILAHNDTSAAPGHQGGMVFPKELRCFLPALDETRTSALYPTIDQSLHVDMYDDVTHVASGKIRYQFQTWGNRRPPESRLTEGIAPLRTRASAGDVMVFQRKIDELDRFRFILIRRNTHDFDEISSLLGTHRWGRLYQDQTPLTRELLINAKQDVERFAQGPFHILNPEVRRSESRQIRIARSSVFRESVRREYGHRCAVSGICIEGPDSLYEVESAHVVPLGEGGTDDIRNGVALTRTLHWAFDQGLFGITSNRTIHVPIRIQQLRENEFLKQFVDHSISEASNPSLRVHPDACKWHLEHCVAKWE